MYVTLFSKQEAIVILKSKSKYNEPVKILEDRTTKQHDYLSKLRIELKCLVDSGELNYTIRYVNGVPKIVNINLNSIKKPGANQYTLKIFVIIKLNDPSVRISSLASTYDVFSRNLVLYPMIFSMSN